MMMSEVSDDQACWRHEQDRSGMVATEMQHTEPLILRPMLSQMVVKKLI